MDDYPLGMHSLMAEKRRVDLLERVKRLERFRIIDTAFAAVLR